MNRAGLIALSFLLLPAAALADVVDNPDAFDKKLVPMSWYISLNGAAKWDQHDDFAGGGGIDFAFGKHIPAQKTRITHGDWLGLSVRFDNLLRLTIAPRYGYLFGRDRHKVSTWFGIYVTGGIDLDFRDGNTLMFAMFGFEQEFAVLARLGRPRSDRRPLLGPVLTLRELPVPGGLEVALSVRFVWDVPMFHEGDLD